MFDLLPEMCAAIERIEPRHIDALQAAGVPAEIAQPTDGSRRRWGILKVLPDGKRLFVPEPETGREAYVIFDTDRAGIADLIAFGLGAPERWRRRIDSTTILNAASLSADGYRWMDGPPEVVPTPLDWLRSGCETSCVLDWSDTMEIRIAYQHHREIIAPDMVGRKLHAILSRPPHVPRFLRPKVQEVRDAA